MKIEKRNIFHSFSNKLVEFVTNFKMKNVFLWLHQDNAVKNFAHFWAIFDAINISIFFNE